MPQKNKPPMPAAHITVVKGIPYNGPSITDSSTTDMTLVDDPDALVDDPIALSGRITALFAGPISAAKRVITGMKNASRVGAEAVMSNPLPIPPGINIITPRVTGSGTRTFSFPKDDRPRIVNSSNRGT